ncbi:hypothetical protein [uncultured Methylobacterium sp.]|uniref:hypothetical protein n=1 Tax=uncultured Methylobacterium sp. TaxID=157278 RepID=UPI0035CB0541
MLVYGDTTRTGAPGEAIARLAAALREAAAAAPGIQRHGALAAALVEAGELLQGLADADFLARGRDAPSATQDAAAGLLTQVAGAVWASWQGGFAIDVPSPDILRGLDAVPLPAAITTRWAEGFAFYALYPEGYALAAMRSGLPAATRVIGIRSIGAPLAAMVAAGLGAEAPATVRPVGHPFRRELALADALTARLVAGDPPAFAVADEGPGLSGSSLGAVADALEAMGVPEARLALFPSHGGPPGPRASERHRARWDRLARHVAPFADIVLAPRQGLAAWAADLIGPAEAPLEEVSGGGWRRHHYAAEADWPPVNMGQERRKFLMRAGGQVWLLKFAGLGREAARKLARARTLHAAGFTPEPAGLRHGFLVERWVGEARPLDRGAIEPDRLAERVGCYLGFRARTFGREAGHGASLADLVAMARHNAAEALGSDAARALDRWTPDRVASLARRERPVEIDGRLHPWEWLVLPDGRLLKCDALDHHAGHDLVGCRDIAWDVAGAAEELALPPAALARLTAVIARAGGRAVDPHLLALLTPCYLAFQLGAHTMAAASASDPGEAARLGSAVARYAARLAHALAADPA